MHLSQHLRHYIIFKQNRVKELIKNVFLQRYRNIINRSFSKRGISQRRNMFSHLFIHVESRRCVDIMEM